MRGPARSSRRLLLGALLAVSVGAETGRSEEAAPAPADPAARPAPTLEQLMKLPSAGSYGMERRGGLTRGEWRSRFARVEAALEEEERSLEAAQVELDRIAGSADQWLFGPPGTTNTDAPLDYRLRQEIQRHKDEIERLERAQRDLIVEANLAGVPEDWRQ